MPFGVGAARFLLGLALATAPLTLVACGDDALAGGGGQGGQPGVGGGGEGGSAAGGDGAGGAAPIPFDTIPCDAPEHWPLAAASADLPILVHYREPAEEEMALLVLGHLETSWLVETEELGFRAPLTGDDQCGPDGDFDVFLWRGIEECYVDARAENTATAWDDWYSYMVVDPWGPYGGEILGSTIAHELNHACQAADDWYDAPIAYEMTAVWVEDLIAGDDVYLELLSDFQSRPEWSLDRNDDYETWYMYGAALYLHYLRDRFFAADPSFAGELWLRSRSAPAENEPDFEDAIDSLLGERAGATYLDSVVEFARWRWYTGRRDDGEHFSEGALFPDEASVAIAAVVDGGELPATLELQVMALGSAYVELPAGGGDVVVGLAAADAVVSWVVQIVPGLDGAGDGSVLDLGRGPVIVPSGRTVILTALPAATAADPDGRSDDLYAATLSVDGA